MEDNQVWARLATLEQMCEEQGLDAHGGLARRSKSEQRCCHRFSAASTGCTTCTAALLRGSSYFLLVPSLLRHPQARDGTLPWQRGRMALPGLGVC